MPCLHYILDDADNIIPCDRDTWAAWIVRSSLAPRRRVLRADCVADGLVITVFVGLADSDPNIPPCMYETIVFHGPGQVAHASYATREEAAEGHLSLVRGLTEMTGDPLASIIVELG